MLELLFTFVLVDYVLLVSLCAILILVIVACLILGFLGVMRGYC